MQQQQFGGGKKVADQSWQCAHSSVVGDNGIVVIYVFIATSVTKHQGVGCAHLMLIAVMVYWSFEQRCVEDSRFALWWANL